MKKLALFFFLGLLLPGSAGAFAKYADFDRDAKPILSRQHGLIDYVLTHYDVKPIGYAKYPGNDQHPPLPPFIFQARRIDSDGPYTFGLYIVDGEPGHILRVVHLHSPKVPQDTPVSPTPHPAPVQETPTGSPQNIPQENPPPSTPTNTPPSSDTPTGPASN